MNREVIQDFLNLPGIVGVALTNRRMRPYFQGLNANLDERQQQALAQGILQVLENMPEGFDAFEFYFAGNIVFIYKLAHGLVLLVLTDQYLDIKNYRFSIAKIRQAVDADVYNAVATFKLLLGSVSQTSSAWAGSISNRPVEDDKVDKTVIQAQVTTIQAKQTKAKAKSNPKSLPATSEATKNYQSNHHQAQPVTSPPTNNQQPRSIASSTARSSGSHANNANNQIENKRPAPLETSKPVTKPVSAKSSPQTYKLDELLAAMNQVSKFTTQYLGKVVVKNYWSSSRPKSNAWLQEFQIDRSGQISHPAAHQIECDQQQRSQLQAWVATYIKRCQIVIRNFDSMITQDCLEPEQAKLLFGK
jgi:uncharacterized lipoprotein YmbA